MKKTRRFKKELNFFSNFLRTKRFELDLSQDKFAELTDFHTNAIGKLERGETVPTYITILKLAKALKISPRELISKDIISE